MSGTQALDAGRENTEPIALDVHAHLAPVFPDALATIDGVTWDAARGVLVVDGHDLGMKPLFQPEALLRWMDAQHVARTWISAPPPLYRQQLDPIAARRWADYLNVGLQRIASAHSTRLAPLDHLPLEHPTVAIDLAAECVAQGSAGFAVAAGGFAAPVYSDAVLEPLWETLDRAGAFVFLHPGQCCDGRLRAFYLDNLVGNPYETAVAAAHLALAGVAERHPRVKFCLAHGGGATAMLAGRLQRGRDTARPGIDPSHEAPRNALRRFFVDSIVHDPATLAFAAHVFGEDQVLFGSDWPFPMGLPDPHQQLARVASGLRRKILDENPRRLLAGMPDRPPTTAPER